MCKSDRTADGRNSIAVWTGDGCVKILRDAAVPADLPSTLQIELAKNEREGAQIFLHAFGKASFFSVKTEALKGENTVIPASDITVFFEKFIKVIGKKAPDGDFPEGSFVPDALLPMDVAAAYGENEIRPGENAALFVEVKTDKDTPAGTYRGNIFLQTEETQIAVPVTVRVFDFCLPDVSHAKNYWNLMGSSFGSQEMDSSLEMFEAYLQAYHAYKMNAKLPFFGEGGVEEYVRVVKKYYHRRGMALYNFYYESTPCIYNGTECLFNAPLLKEYLTAIAKESVTDGVNYLDKAMLSFSDMMDEPALPTDFKKIQTLMGCFGRILRETAETLDSLYADREKYSFYYAEVRNALLRLPSPIAENFHDSKMILEKAYGTKNVTHCPIIWDVESKKSRDMFADDGEKYWFYTCDCPVYPYPTTHIDDYTVTGRTMYWMQKAYNIDGYLNWDGALHRVAPPYVSAYETSTRGFGPGDGFVFYPGAEYGIYGPVASLRAAAQRDGAEDYDYLCILESRYGERNFSADYVLNDCFRRLFWGTTATRNSADLYAARKKVAAMIEETGDKLGLFYLGVETAGDFAVCKFAAACPDAEVFVSGEKTEKDSTGKFTVKAEKNAESVTFSLRCGEAERTVTFSLPEEKFCPDFGCGAEYVFVNSDSGTAVSTEYVTGRYGQKSLMMILKSGENAAFFGGDAAGSCARFGIKMSAFEIPPSAIGKISFMLKSFCPDKFTLKVCFYDGWRYKEIDCVPIYDGFNHVVLDSLSVPDDAKELVFIPEGHRQNRLKLFLDGISYIPKGRVLHEK